MFKSRLGAGSWLDLLLEVFGKSIMSPEEEREKRGAQEKKRRRGEQEDKKQEKVI